MTFGTLTGGLRDRMVIESVREQITDHLNTLGWFDGGRYHEPLVLVEEFPDDNDEVVVNTVAFSVEDATGRDLEMGSNAEDHSTMFFVDMFMEDDSVGWHLSGDIYAYLKVNKNLDVFDYENAKVVDFTVSIEGVDRRKPKRATQAWMKYWFTVSFDALDPRANA